MDEEFRRVRDSVLSNCIRHDSTLVQLAGRLTPRSLINIFVLELQCEKKSRSTGLGRVGATFYPNEHDHDKRQNPSRVLYESIHLN